MILQTGKATNDLGFRVQGNNQKPAPNLCTLRSSKGLTLIEVLLAVSILAIGIIGVLRAYAGSLATLEVGQFSVDSVNILKQKIAEVELGLLEEGKAASKSGSGELNEFLWEWSIRSTDIEGLNELSMMVSHKSNPRTLSAITYVVEPKEKEEEE